MLTQSELKELLHYDPNTGEFTWLVERLPTKPNDSAGSKNKNGYIHIKINGRIYKAHRLVWLYMTGNWPNNIDHIDGNGYNNCWNNLRECSHAENQQNRIKSKTNKSGFLGVSWDKINNKWMAQINVNGQKKFLGRYATPQEAHHAYLDAKAKYHTFNPIPR